MELQICQNMRNIFTRSSNAKYAIKVQIDHRQRQYTYWYICESWLLGLSFTATAALFICRTKCRTFR